MVLSDTGIVKMQNLYPHVNKATKKQRKDELNQRKIFPSFLCPQALLTFQVWSYNCVTFDFNKNYFLKHFRPILSRHGLMMIVWFELLSVRTAFGIQYSEKPKNEKCSSRLVTLKFGIILNLGWQHLGKFSLLQVDKYRKYFQPSRRTAVHNFCVWKEFWDLICER